MEEIIDYLDSQSAQAADGFAAKLDENCRLHATHPLIGASSKEFAPDLRHFSVSNHAVFYRPIADGIEIIRILHGARDLSKEL